MYRWNKHTQNTMEKCIRSNDMKNCEFDLMVYVNM